MSCFGKCLPESGNGENCSWQPSKMKTASKNWHQPREFQQMTEKPFANGSKRNVPRANLQMKHCAWGVLSKTFWMSASTDSHLQCDQMSHPGRHWLFGAAFLCCNCGVDSWCKTPNCCSIVRGIRTQVLQRRTLTASKPKNGKADSTIGRMV